MDSASLESCTIGRYGNSFGLGSWSLEVIENQSGICTLDYSFEMEMGYQNFDCQIPIDDLKTVDWNRDYAPISSDLIDQYCTLERSGNIYYDLAFYWYLVNIVIIASIIGAGVLIFFIIRRLRRKKKNN